MNKNPLHGVVTLIGFLAFLLGGAGSFLFAAYSGYTFGSEMIVRSTVGMFLFGTAVMAYEAIDWLDRKENEILRLKHLLNEDDY